MPWAKGTFIADVRSGTVTRTATSTWSYPLASIPKFTPTPDPMAMVEVVFGPRRKLSERVYFDRRDWQTASRTPASSNSKATGEQRLCNVYAYNGRAIARIAKRRFRSFRLTPLDGSAAQQGMACFAQIDGRYAMIAGRTESLYRPLRRFVYVERQSRHPSTRVSVGFVQIGSCGSPIEMRGAGCCDARVGSAKVFVGAVLLDKDDP